jgi:hypothetical protein
MTIERFTLCHQSIGAGTHALKTRKIKLDQLEASAVEQTDANDTGDQVRKAEGHVLGKTYEQEEEDREAEPYEQVLNRVYR